jgi:hypothetical protein
MGLRFLNGQDRNFAPLCKAFIFSRRHEKTVVFYCPLVAWFDCGALGSEIECRQGIEISMRQDKGR